MSRSSRIAATLAITGSLLVTGIGGTTLAQATPLQFAGGFGSLDLGSIGLDSWDLGSSQPSADAPRLAGIDNFRDVAGTGAGYSGSLGRHVNKSVFYRANAITPRGDDMAALEKLGLTKVYDLRTDGEIAATPDVLPAGVLSEQISILSKDVDITAMMATIRTAEDMRSAMQDMNRLFVTGAVERSGFNKLLTGLAETNGPQVFHCTSGKDRTGWTAMLLLSIAGVDQSTIMSDYLLTNEYSVKSIEATTAYIKATYGEAVAAIAAPALGVESSFLQAGLDQVKLSYGSIDHYLTDGLGLSQTTIAALKTKLLS